MKCVTYTIDPDGDVELLLEKPNSQQIVPHVPSNEYNEELEDLMSEPTVARPMLAARYHAFDDLLSPAEAGQYLNPFGTMAYPSTVPGESAFATHNTPKVRTTFEGEVRIRVSSRHLTLASRTFRSMLKGFWSEASSTSSTFGKPLRLIRASRWDAVAFAIVLDIIHGRHRGVPRYVDLPLMTRIATIVDYYHCHEVVQIFADFWYEDISANVAEEYSSRTLMRLFASWVFRNERVWNAASGITLRHMDDVSQIDTKELHLGGVLAKINETRQDLINKIIAALDDLHDNLSTSKFLCDWHKFDSPNCSSVTLSILERELQSLAESDRPLLPPFNGYSVVSMIQLINDIPESIAATTEEYDHYNDVAVCSVRARMRHVLGDVKNEMNSWALDLDMNVRSG
ncbi:hypothetical protein FGADI_3766 [Fusarium gaditjirri]|uniref:BTB domain-containing protein n=1 Tax=Fusarium gaditjirri TaxID=282569 RepID=A0A8H4X0K4_9HYPO|nr:hypothetical protein FGADI_3766 [Fusarium gaditjirri]